MRIGSLLVHSLMWPLCTGVPSKCSSYKIVSPGTGTDLGISGKGSLLKPSALPLV